MCISDKTEICPFVHIIIIIIIILLLGPRHIQPPSLQPTHRASINSAIGSTQSSVCVPVEMIHMHTYTGKGV